MKLRSLHLLIILAFVLAACVPQATPTPAPVEPTAPPAAAETEAPPAGEKVDVVKVGGLYPLSGTDAINGETMKKGHEQAVKEINEAGGIECLGGAKIEMVYGDSQSKTEAGNSETERLITQEKVSAIMGAFHSHVVIPATEISEKYEVPFLVPNALAGEITNRGLKYVFQTIPTLEQWAADGAKFAAEQGAKSGVIAVMNIAFGEETQAAWEAGLPEAGIEIKDSIQYQFGASDLSDTVLKFKAADPDVVFLLCNTTDCILFTKQMQELDYYPKMGIINLGGGFADPTYLQTVGKEAAQGIFLTSDWFPKINLPGAEEFSNYFLEQQGILPTGAVNTTYATTWLLKDALEKACSTDPKKIAEVLRTTTFTPGPDTKWAFQWPEVSFDETGKLEQMKTVIAQYQDGNQMAVWPDNLAVAKPIWPVPDWKSRSELGTSLITPEAVEDPALASDYSKALLKDAATPVDTSMYKKDGPYTIAVSQQDPSNGWGNTYNVSILGYGEELLKQGVLAKPLLVSATNDANQQISDMENFIEQKPDAIVIEPLGRAASVAVIERAIDAGIPVVLCANGIESDKFTTRVDIDFYEVAYRSGDGLAKLMGGKGNVILFNGIAGVDSTETWRKAAMDALAKYPDIKIIAEEYAQWNIATSKQKMEALMAANPQIDGIWAGGGEMVLGAALAYEDAGKPFPKFAMVNVPNGFLRLADQYKLEFVGSPDPPGMSRHCLQTAIDILQGKPVMKFISLRTLMDGADPYDQTSFIQWYVPELNDDFIPPMTVDLSYYLNGGFGRK